MIFMDKTALFVAMSLQLKAKRFKNKIIGFDGNRSVNLELEG
jgi:hypothetical protein